MTVLINVNNKDYALDINAAEYVNKVPVCEGALADAVLNFEARIVTNENLKETVEIVRKALYSKEFANAMLENQKVWFVDSIKVFELVDKRTEKPFYDVSVSVRVR